jgi:hypothetical protein
MRRLASPTQRTLEVLRGRGYLAAVVEHWNPHAFIRQDLFGIFDVLAVGHGHTLAVQACATGDIQRRRRKLEASEALDVCKYAGWLVEVWGWTKYAKLVERKLWRPTVIRL